MHFVLWYQVVNSFQVVCPVPVTGTGAVGIHSRQWQPACHYELELGYSLSVCKPGLDWKICCREPEPPVTGTGYITYMLCFNDLFFK